MREIALHYLVASVVPILACALVIFFAWKNERACAAYAPMPLEMESRRTPLGLVLVLLAILLSFGAMALCIYSAWYGGDDYIASLNGNDRSLISHAWVIRNEYLNTVSRWGELWRNLLGLNVDNRWQHILITSSVFSVLPFAVHRLVAGVKKSIFTVEGFFFYIFCVSVCAVGIYTANWKPYICYSAAANYFWPSVLTIYLLSFYRPSNWHEADSKKNILFVGILGLGCGWAIECVSPLVLGCFALWLLWHFIKKRAVPRFCIAGVLGYIWGVFMLFTSPALAMRKSGGLEKVPYEQLDMILANMTPENIQKLDVAYGVIVFSFLDPIKRLLFVPFWANRFWQCCHVGLIVAGVLIAFITLAWFIRSKMKTAAPFKVIALALLFILAGWTSAFAYVAGGTIPSEMSFMPPCYMIALACCLLFTHVKQLLVRVLVSVSMLIYALSIVAPAVNEALEYKQYEYEFRAEIARQKMEGKDEIYLPAPYAVLPKDRMNLIKRGLLRAKPDDYPNHAAKAAFGVKAISQEPLKRNHDDK